jgi:UDP-glucose:(heptosyl)LPS alpha-1,3-glucosyltransferase
VRIGLIVHDYNRTGGHSRYVVELVSRFAPTHDVHVFANTFDEPLAPGAHPHRIPSLRTTALTTVLTFAAGRPGRGMPLDILHAQGFCGARADVVTAHICNARWAETRRGAGGHLGWRDRLFASAVVPLERRALTVPGTAVIAVSQNVGDDLARYYGRRDSVHVIPHGVDTEQFNPSRTADLRADARRAHAFAPADCVLLFVGDLRKGADVLIEAAAVVPGTKVLLVSRSDPQPYLSLAARHGLANRIVSAGPTSAIERAYAAADVFVFPTRYDAFAMVVTEAMACGLPVVTSRQAGASEIITDRVDGILLRDPADRAAWTQAIAALAADPRSRIRLGRAAAETAARFTWDQVARQTLAVYEQVLRSRRNGAAA